MFKRLPTAAVRNPDELNKLFGLEPTATEASSHTAWQIDRDVLPLLKGKVVVMTGAPPKQMGRKADVATVLIQQAHVKTVEQSFTKHTQILLYQNAGNMTSKLQKAQKAGITCVSYDTLLGHATPQEQKQEHLPSPDADEPSSPAPKAPAPAPKPSTVPPKPQLQKTPAPSGKVDVPKALAAIKSGEDGIGDDLLNQWERTGEEFFYRKENADTFVVQGNTVKIGGLSFANWEGVSDGVAAGFANTPEEIHELQTNLTKYLSSDTGAKKFIANTIEAALTSPHNDDPAVAAAAAAIKAGAAVKVANLQFRLEPVEHELEGWTPDSNGEDWGFYNATYFTSDLTATIVIQ